MTEGKARLLSAGTCLVMLCCAVTASAQSWPKAYEEWSTNEFVGDKRFPALLMAKVHQAFAKELQSALLGPPNPVYVIQDRYFSASACAHRYCPNKGFFWLDTRTGAGLGGVLQAEYPGYMDGHLRLDSRHIVGSLPDAAREAVVEWLDSVRVNVRSVSFVDASGRIESLSVGLFRLPARFEPPESGPSFDCSDARQGIERLICTDDELARLDLKIFRMYALIRAGSGTTHAVGQLSAMQRAWVARRESTCATAADQTACLRAYYDRWWSELQSWVPTPQRPLKRPKK